MQHFLRRVITQLFVILTLISGCAPKKQPDVYVLKIQPEVVESTLEQARLSIETLEEIEEAVKMYQNDLQEARLKYDDAERSFQKREFDKSYAEALTSLTISRKVIKNIYSQVLEPSAEKIKAEIETKIAQDPNSPLKDFIPQLNEILDRTKKLKGRQQPPSLAEFLHDFSEIEQIGTIAKEDERKTLTGDVSFAKGQYELSEEGKNLLQGMAHHIIALIDERAEAYPESTIFVKITVSGYTDQLGFREGTDLVRKLLQGVPEPIPSKGSNARRQLLNQRLSEFRARTIGEHLRENILHAKLDISHLKVELEVLGFGEKIPEDVSAPYPKDDARRRICRMYRYVSAR